MGTRAVIAVALANGTLIASNVAYDGDEALAVKLNAHYGTYDKATGLIALGDLSSIDANGTITPSTVSRPYETYADLDALDAGKLGNAHHVHVFQDGKWERLLDDEGQYFENMEDEPALA